MPDVQIHHKYQKEICKRFLFSRIHHDIAFPIEGGGRIFWSYVYPRQFELLCEPDVLSELCLTPRRKVFNMSPYLKLTFTQLSGVTLRRQIELLLLSWPT